MTYPGSSCGGPRGGGCRSERPVGPPPPASIAPHGAAEPAAEEGRGLPELEGPPHSAAELELATNRLGN